MRSINIVATACLSLTFSACGGTGAENATPSPQEAGATEAEGSVLAGRMRGDRGHYESVIEMIRGRVPGVEVLEVQPGVIQLRIRGMNQSLQATGQEPLVVVDGVPSSRPAGEALLSLIPDDVASIQVLKDVGSTAVYGTRGANGVILVMLKRRDSRSP